MKTIVTGSEGFLGSHLCDFLLGRKIDHELPLVVAELFRNYNRNIPTKNWSAVG